MSLDFSNGAKPLWSQLLNIIREKIEQEEYKVGDILPSEMQLIDQYGVSRITVRQALDKLMKDGYIDRRRGKGTIVIRKKEEVATVMKSSFTQLEEIGKKSHKKLLEVKVVQAPKEVAEFFNISEDDNVLVMKRVIEVEGKVVTLFHNYISPVVPVTVKDNFTGSFYNLLESKGYKITSGKEEISAVISDKKDKAIFGLKEPKAILTRKKFGYSKEVPVELTYSRYLAEGYLITIELN